LLDLTRIPDSVVSPIVPVVRTALAHAHGLTSDDIMVVGACCRDILHSALGHSFPNTATHDLDLALALSSWPAYESLAAAFPAVGDTGIRFLIADVVVDLIPFSGIEDPAGIATPRSRGESLSVWAFREIFTASLGLPLAPDLAIRLPTPAGYTAAKIGAWLDRSNWHEVKDAPDLALSLYWYFESTDICDQLYATPDGNDVLLREGTDLPLAAAHLLGLDVANTIGPARLTELLDRWPGNAELLIRELVVRGGPAWTRDPQRRRAFLDALTRGLTDPRSHDT